jgi:6-phosphofructokinase 1
MPKNLKGNLLVGQSGGPSAVVNSSLCGVIQEGMLHDEIKGIYGAHNGIQGLLMEHIVDLRREKPSTITGLRRTPTMALGSCRYKAKEEDYERILDLFARYNVRYFFYIGGNDSMHSTHEIGRIARERGHEMRVMGVPKTIDNDLAFTDHSPGYGSAARFEAITASEMVMDTLSLRYTEVVKVIETMGRNSGWVTAATALAGEFAPDLIYVPERPLVPQRLLNDVQAVFKKKGWVVIAACEGLKNPEGKYAAAYQAQTNVDAFGHPELGGLGQYLVDLIVENLKLKTRLDKPGTMQRSSGLCISPVDAEEAYLVGKTAVEAAVGGTSDMMVMLVREPGREYRCTTGFVELERVANAEKLMPDDFINEDGNGVTKAFVDYALPLLGGPLPEYVKLENFPVGGMRQEKQ